MTDPDTKAITDALAAPFDPREVKWKPQTVKGNRAMAMCYIDARLVQDRLDEVLGVVGWQDEYEILPDGSVMCKLKIQIGSTWLTKMDVGSPSEQPDGGDRLKAAFSDSLKRAAVKFGVGRYLYRLPAQWCDYDPVKKQFAQTPTLPDFARPKPKPKSPPPGPTDAAPKPAPASQLPANGADLFKRLSKKDEAVAAEGKCAAGELLSYVAWAGEQAGYGSVIAEWEGPAIAFAASATTSFVEQQIKAWRKRRGELAAAYGSVDSWEKAQAVHAEVEAALERGEIGQVDLAELAKPRASVNELFPGPAEPTPGPPSGRLDRVYALIAGLEDTAGGEQVDGYLASCGFEDRDNLARAKDATLAKLEANLKAWAEQAHKPPKGRKRAAAGVN